MSLLLFFLGEEMPENQISFKTRVKNALIQYAGVYYSQFVCKDYLLISDAFHKQAYYILSAEKDNFLHLTGVTTSLSPSSFFDKCLNGSLEEDDFDLTSHGQDEKASKGSIRRKIKSLPYIGGLISASSYVEEDFRKNSVFCSIASSDGSCTMGFIAVPKARPKTLLIGNELDSAKAQPLKIILMKSRSDTLFDTVIAGNDNDLVSNYELIKTHIDAALNSRILSAFPNEKNPESIKSTEEPSES